MSLDTTATIFIFDMRGLFIIFLTTSLPSFSTLTTKRVFFNNFHLFMRLSIAFRSLGITGGTKFTFSDFVVAFITNLFP